WIRRTISRPCSRLSPLYTSLTSPASVRMRVMTVQRLRTAYVLPPKFFVSGISIAIASTLWTRMVPCRPDPLAPSVRHDRGALHAGLRRRMLAQIDDLVGAEPPRQLEPLVHAVNDDHARRAHLARHRARVDAETARALDDDDLPGAEPGQVEAGVDLGVGAVHARRHLVGDLVGELEDGVVRSQVEVLAEASLEVWPRLARDEPVGLAHRARLGALPETGAAAPTREEVPVGDAVAHRHGPAGGVGRHPRPQLRHASHVLVPGVERERPAHL